MTDAAPKRIWVSAPNEDNEVETWTDPDEGGTEYILASELATLRAQVERLTGAAEALGAMPGGYCFCSRNRIGDDSKTHEPECADLRAALTEGAASKAGNN